MIIKKTFQHSFDLSKTLRQLRLSVVIVSPNQLAFGKKIKNFLNVFYDLLSTLKIKLPAKQPLKR